MNAIDPTLFNSLLASLRALPGSEQMLLEQVVRELSARLASESGQAEVRPPPSALPCRRGRNVGPRN